MSQTQKKRNSKKGSLSMILLLLLGIAMIGTALWMLVPTLLDYKKSNDTYQTLETDFVKVEAAPAAEIEVPEEDTWWYTEVDVDLASLKKENQDIIGWIRFDNDTYISYPILYSGDDSTYLRTDIYGNATVAGCIFMEGMNTPDFSDSHTILYGHNMRNKSMFGSLRYYKDQGYYEEEQNQYFTIYTDHMAYRYQIFAYRDVPETSSLYAVGFAPDETFQKFIDEMYRNSYIESGVTATKDDKIITLSTCSTTGNRFVVHAVQVEAHELSK